jgi:hypothetical protein
MEELPDYLQDDYQVLKNIFAQKISQEDLEILILLIHENFSQRNLAILLSYSFELDYHEVLNVVFGAGNNKGERNRKRLEEIKSDLIANKFEGSIYR